MTAHDDPLTRLLARLDHVREIRPGQYRAKCPAHDGDSRDSLSIGTAPNGDVLVYDFAGCTADAIVRAVGLELRDLYHARDLTPQERASYATTKQLDQTRRVLVHELRCLAVITSAHLHRWPIEDPDPHRREAQAVARIRAAMGVLYP